MMEFQMLKSIVDMCARYTLIGTQITIAPYQ